MRRKWYYRGFGDVNGHSHHQTQISTFLGTNHYFDAKTLSTSTWKSRGKCKYSSNKQKAYWRAGKGPFRERDTRELFKILKEHGLK